jgi:dephospho-CoA kinase
MNQNKKPRVVAVIGPIAAGKDALADYLAQQHQVMVVEVGAFARQLTRDAAQNEPYLQYDVSAKSLANREPGYIMRRLVAEMTETGEPQAEALVITGVRTPAEATVLKDHFGPDLLLTYVKGGGPKQRYERVEKRDFATDPNDFVEFAQRDEQMKSENALEETIALADVTLWNDSTLESYHRQIETHIVPHLFPKK